MNNTNTPSGLHIFAFHCLRHVAKLQFRSIYSSPPSRLPSAGALKLALVSCVLLVAGRALATERPPNVVIIYTDDQGFGDAACLNADAKFATPNLDRIAKEGISFTDAHSSDTVCTPSRYGLLTGRYSWRTTLKRGVFGAERKGLIDDGRMTIATLLRDAGYATGMVGKWHLGMDFPGDPGDRDWTMPVKDMPLDKGFDYFFGIPASMNYGVLAWFEGRHAKVPPTLFTAKKPNKIAISDYRIKPPYQSTPEATKEAIGSVGMETASDFVDSECLTRFTDKAIRWIQSKSEASKTRTPFFLYLPYTSPHKPVIPLPEFRGKGEAGAYGEFMIETDYQVGRILKLLDELQIADDTLLILTSDNGPETTWKARIKKFGHHSNHIYREGKRSLYEGGHRVPFLVRWPNGIKRPGREWTNVVCQTDILATIAEIIDQPLSDNAAEDSQSLLPILLDTNQSHARQPTIHHGVAGGFAIRLDDWKLVMPHQKRKKMELYNLAHDPSEKNDLSAQQPHKVGELKDALTKAVCQGRTRPGRPQSNDTGYWASLNWITESEYDEVVAKLSSQ